MYIIHNNNHDASDIPISIIQSLNQPSHVVVDAQNFVYISDTYNNRIVKFDTKGVQQQIFIPVISSGGADPYLQGIAVDLLGNVYVVDASNHQVYKFNRDGIQQNFSVTTTPPLKFPIGIAVIGNDTGDIYIADSDNNRIVKLNYLGIQEQIFTTTNPSLKSPSDVFIDSQGNIYIADTKNYRIVKFNSQGIQLQIFNNNEMGLITSIIVDSNGNMYVIGDNLINKHVRKFSAAGVFQQTLNTLFPGLSSPNGLACDETDHLYIADTDNNRIVKLNQNGIQVQVFSFPYPHMNPGSMIISTTTGTDQIYIADSYHRGAIQLNRLGLYQQLFVSSSSSNPTGVALDKLGNVYITDASTGYIVKYNSQGQQLQIFISVSLDSSDETPFRSYLAGCAIDSNQNIYVTDSINNWIIKLDSFGIQQQMFTTTNPSISQPNGIIVDPNTNNIYVADSGNNRLVKFNSAGVVQQIFNTTAPSLNGPQGVALDHEGNLYVADTGNNRTVVFDVRGNQIQVFTTSSPSLSNPKGVAIDSAGNVWVSDSGNNRIVVFHVSHLPSIDAADRDRDGARLVGHTTIVSKL